MTPQEAVEYLFGAAGEALLKRDTHVKCQECKAVLVAALTKETIHEEEKENPNGAEE